MNNLTKKALNIKEVNKKLESEAKKLEDDLLIIEKFKNKNESVNQITTLRPISFPDLKSNRNNNKINVNEKNEQLRSKYDAKIKLKELEKLELIQTKLLGKSKVLSKEQQVTSNLSSKLTPNTLLKPISSQSQRSLLDLNNKKQSAAAEVEVVYGLLPHDTSNLSFMIPIDNGRSVSVVLCIGSRELSSFIINVAIEALENVFGDIT